MVEISFDADKVVFEILGLHKILAFKSQLVIPRANITDARHDPTAFKVFSGMRTLGINIPGVLIAGSFKHKGEKLFWDVFRKENLVVIELQNEKYNRLCIEVEDPSLTVAMFNRKE